MASSPEIAGSRSIVNPLSNRLHVLQKWVGAGLDLLFPIRCAGCAAPGSIWCQECDDLTIALVEPLCPDCGKPLETGSACPSCSRRRPGLKVRSYTHYDGRAAKALLHMKYRPDRKLAAVMGGWLMEAYTHAGWHAGLVAPVPLSKQKIRERGFNQALLLAEEFVQRARLPVDWQHLKRIEDTRSQVGLDPYERWENVSGAFSAEAHAFQGEDVLIIDDLLTTGATLSACAAAIRAAGARSVVGLTVARA